MKRALSILICLCFIGTGYASHLRCGQIVVKQKAPGSSTVMVTVEVFLNTINTNVMFGGEDDWLDFGDGSRVLVPEQDLTMRLDLNPSGGVAYSYYTVEHTYPALGSYTVSYKENFRNVGILNFDNSLLTYFYVETTFLLMTDIAYETPAALQLPVFLGFVGKDFSASVAAVDANNFALRYALQPPLMDKATPVENYQLSGSTFVNPLTGLFTWDGKFRGELLVGEFLFGVRIDQYDTREEPWVRVGRVFKDVQVIISDDVAQSGDFRDNITNEQNIVQIPENETGSIKVFAYPGEENVANLSVQTDLPENYYSFAMYDSAQGEQAILVGKLEIMHDPTLTRILPYIISVRASFTNERNERHFRDQNFAFVTQELPPFYNVVTSTIRAEENISVAPNPFRDFVRIKGLRETNLPVAIYNSTGQLVLTTHTDDDGMFDLSQLSPGMYFLKGVGKDGRLVVREKVLKH